MPKKLFVTKRQAIRDCKKIWKLVAEGKATDKFDALRQLPDILYKYFDFAQCPLCAYAYNKEGAETPSACRKYCPYYLTYKAYCTSFYCSYTGNPIAFAKRILALKD